MKKFGKQDLQALYANHHFEDGCTGHWEEISGPDMPYKVDDGITILLQNPPMIRCKSCEAQFFEKGFEEKMLRSLAKLVLFDQWPLSANYIRFVRSLAGLSQTEVARELGFRKEAISRYESRKDPQIMQSGEQVRFKLLMIARLGFEIPEDAELWKLARMSPAKDSLIRKIDAKSVLAS